MPTGLPEPTSKRDGGDEGGDSNEAPTARFSYVPSTVNVGEEVTFDASNSSDPDGSVEEYVWMFDTSSMYGEKTGKVVNMTFEETGFVEVTLEAYDDENSKDVIEKSIQVEEKEERSQKNQTRKPNKKGKKKQQQKDGGASNAEPVARFDVSPSQPTVNDTLTLNASDSLDTDGNVTEYVWFVNGVRVTNGTVVSYTPNFVGSVNVTLMVSDDGNVTDTQNKTVSVVKSVGADKETRNETRTGATVNGSEAETSRNQTRNQSQSQDTPGFTLVLTLVALIAASGFVAWRKSWD
ncbi:MAG: PKD domain-containing protein [Halobacteria archaeon]|nr:PKD domain-containing protein [Halobacteria archaeon]